MEGCWVISRSPMVIGNSVKTWHVLYSFVVLMSQKGNIQALSVFIPHTRQEKIIGESALFAGYAYTSIHEIGKTTFLSSKQPRIKLSLGKQAAMRNGARISFSVHLHLCAKNLANVFSFARALPAYDWYVCQDKRRSRVHSNSHSSVSILFITHFVIKEQRWSIP